MTISPAQEGLLIISEYLKALAERPLEDVLYRGHGDATWSLVPSVFRPGTFGIDSSEVLKRWSRLAGRMARPMPQSSIEWLVLAQHYGIATPLLDWTANPLIALFFAANDAPKSTGCVWQVRTTGAFDTFAYPATVEPFRKDRSRPGLIFASQMNARSTAQDSAMSIHRSADDVIPSELMRVVYRVAPDSKFPILRGLASLGFQIETLFSDLSMLAERFKVEEILR